MSNFYFNVNERSFTLIQGRENEALTELSNLVENKKYNLGELVIGKNGKLDRINSHESSFFSNNKITKPDENRMVRTAVLQTLSKVKNPNGDNSDAFKYISKVMTGKDFIELPLTRREVCAYLKILKGEIQLDTNAVKESTDTEHFIKMKGCDQKILRKQKELNKALADLEKTQAAFSKSQLLNGRDFGCVKDALDVYAFKQKNELLVTIGEKENAIQILKDKIRDKKDAIESNNEIMKQLDQVKNKDYFDQLQEKIDVSSAECADLQAKCDKLEAECKWLKNDLAGLNCDRKQLLAENEKNMHKAQGVESKWSGNKVFGDVLSEVGRAKSGIRSSVRIAFEAFSYMKELEAYKEATQSLGQKILAAKNVMEGHIEVEKDDAAVVALRQEAELLGLVDKDADVEPVALLKMMEKALSARNEHIGELSQKIDNYKNLSRNIEELETNIKKTIPSIQNEKIPELKSRKEYVEKQLKIAKNDDEFMNLKQEAMRLEQDADAFELEIVELEKRNKELSDRINSVKGNHPEESDLAALDSVLKSFEDYSTEYKAYADANTTPATKGLILESIVRQETLKMLDRVDDELVGLDMKSKADLVAKLKTELAELQNEKNNLPSMQDMLHTKMEEKIRKIHDAEHGVFGSFRSDLDGLGLSRATSSYRSGPSANVLNAAVKNQVIDNHVIDNAYAAKHLAEELPFEKLMKIIVERDHYNQVANTSDRQLTLIDPQFGRRLKLSPDGNFQQLKNLLEDQIYKAAETNMTSPKIMAEIDKLSAKQGFSKFDAGDFEFKNAVFKDLKRAVSSKVDDIFSVLEMDIKAELAAFNSKIGQGIEQSKAKGKVTDKQKVKLFKNLLDTVVQKINESVRSAVSNQNDVVTQVVENAVSNVALKVKIEDDQSANQVPNVENIRRKINVLQDEIKFFSQFKTDGDVVSRFKEEIQSLENMEKLLNAQQNEVPKPISSNLEKNTDIRTFLETDERTRNVLLFNKFQTQRNEPGYFPEIMEKLGSMRVKLGIKAEYSRYVQFSQEELNLYGLEDLKEKMEFMTGANFGMLYRKCGLDWDLLSNYVDFGFSVALDNNRLGTLIDAIRNVGKDINTLLDEPLKRDNIVKAGKLLASLKQMDARFRQILKMGGGDGGARANLLQYLKESNGLERTSKKSGSESDVKKYKAPQVLSDAMKSLSISGSVLDGELLDRFATNSQDVPRDLDFQKKVNDTMAHQLMNVWKFCDSLTGVFSKDDFTNFDKKLTGAIEKYNRTKDVAEKSIDGKDATSVVWSHQKEWDAYTKDFATFASQQVRSGLEGGTFDGDNLDACKYSFWDSKVR